MRELSAAKFNVGPLSPSHLKIDPTLIFKPGVDYRSIKPSPTVRLKLFAQQRPYLLSSLILGTAAATGYIIVSLARKRAGNQ
jgi:hypothetical protein